MDNYTCITKPDADWTVGKSVSYQIKFTKKKEKKGKKGEMQRPENI